MQRSAKSMCEEFKKCEEFKEVQEVQRSAKKVQEFKEVQRVPRVDEFEGVPLCWGNSLLGNP